MSARVHVDGVVHDVPEGRNLLAACLERGHDIPFFCWHGALGAVGACRLCAVRLHDGPDDSEGGIAMACMCGARHGQRVAIADPEAEAFRASVIEWLMINHPHDCPTCAEGGSCHLQDMTLMTGHRTRRYRGRKRTHRSQWLGPLLTHEMNRCIACYRCTRFYRHYAGGRDLDVFGSHDAVYFGRAADGPLESPFAGNLAEVCPTGVFNDRGWSDAYARKWDMMATPSVCAECPVGCNTFTSAREGRVRRVQNRYHGALNGYFLCDRGRFATGADGADRRLSRPRIAGADTDNATARAAACDALAQGAIGIGSPRASMESNLALQRLVGAKRFFVGVPDREAAMVARMAAIMRDGPAGIASLADIEAADAVLALGEDLTGTAPRMALALRQTARGAAFDLARAKGVPDWQDNAVRVAGEGRRTPIFLVTPMADPLDDVAVPVRRTPDEVARFGADVARALAGESAPEATARVARTLQDAERPCVIAGAGLQSPAVVEAAGEVLGALGARALAAFVPPEANSLGLALIGGGGLESAASALEAGEAPTALVLENDLGERAAPETVERVMAAAGTMVALDHIITPTTDRADIALPVAAPCEAAGTLVNYEGRAQRSFAAVADGPPAAWRLLGDMAHDSAALGESLGAALATIAADRPDLVGLRDAMPGPGAEDIARGPAMQPGRTADDRAGQDAAVVPPVDPDSPLVHSMEGRRGAEVPPAWLTGYSVAGWTSANALHRFQDEIGGPLRGGDPGTRLITPGDGTDATEPAAAQPRSAEDGTLAFVPLHDPFVGTETARASPLLAARAPAPRVVLHPDDAAAIGVDPGGRVSIDTGPCDVPVSVTDRIARGCIGVSVGTATPRGGAARVRVEAAP